MIEFLLAIKPVSKARKKRSLHNLFIKSYFKMLMKTCKFAFRTVQKFRKWI